MKRGAKIWTQDEISQHGGPKIRQQPKGTSTHNLYHPTHWSYRNDGMREGIPQMETKGSLPQNRSSNWSYRKAGNWKYEVSPLDIQQLLHLSGIGAKPTFTAASTKAQ